MDFMLIAQYQTHTPGTIQSMKDYLSDFHEYKDVFLRFRTTKATKNAAKQATKDLCEDQHRSLMSDALCPPPLAKCQKLQEQFRTEADELVDDLLSTGAHYNFPKIHLISHFADQIAKYGSLPQYSTEICEASYKPLKDAYRRSNHVNPIPQIIRTYMQAHNFIMRERNIEQWLVELPHIPDEVHSIIAPQRPILHVLKDNPSARTITRLQGRLANKDINTLSILETVYELPDLQALTRTYLTQNHFRQIVDPESHANRLLESLLEAFNTLQVAVPTFNRDGHMIHHICYIGENTYYRLAHISLLTVVGSPIPDSPEGMVHVGTPLKNHIIRIADIEDLHTWNDIHDGN
ncbi:hypothetical protein EV426DRAFT_579158 [Tirmania nivea]|nr:hypothetical protein EV426DRAFT_579158 [Tirmania nivea]